MTLTQLQAVTERLTRKRTPREKVGVSAQFTRDSFNSGARQTHQLLQQKTIKEFKALFAELNREEQGWREARLDRAEFSRYLTALGYLSKLPSEQSLAQELFDLCSHEVDWVLLQNLVVAVLALQGVKSHKIIVESLSAPASLSAFGPEGRLYFTSAAAVDRVAAKFRPLAVNRRTAVKKEKKNPEMPSFQPQIDPKSKKMAPVASQQEHISRLLTIPKLQAAKLNEA